MGNDKDTPDRRYNDSEVTDVDMVAAALSRANSADDGDGDKAGQDQGDAWGFGKASSTSGLLTGKNLCSLQLFLLGSMQERAEMFEVTFTAHFLRWFTSQAFP